MHQLETLIQAIPPAVFAAGGANGMPPHSPLSPIDPSTSTSPHALFASSSHVFPTSIAPPSLSAFPLMNPSTFFAPLKPASRNTSPSAGFPPPNGIGTGMNMGMNMNAGMGMGVGMGMGMSSVDQLAEETARMSLSSSYLYFDDEGYTRWQGETSGLPLLDLLVERHRHGGSAPKPDPDSVSLSASGSGSWEGGAPQNGRGAAAVVHDWFPDRTPRRAETNPEVIWRFITSIIAPELMDRSVAIVIAVVCWGNLSWI